jgi:hypothetical protein
MNAPALLSFHDAENGITARVVHAPGGRAFAVVVADDDSGLLIGSRSGYATIEAARAYAEAVARGAGGGAVTLF